MSKIMWGNITWDEYKAQGDKFKEDRIKELEQRSKKLEEVLVYEKFKVENVLGENYLASSMSVSGEKDKNNSVIYSGVQGSRLILQVIPYLNPERNRVRVLRFNGDLNLISENNIIALIPKYTLESVENSYGKKIDFYLERDFNDEELAIELTLVDDLGKILRVQRGLDYLSYKN